MTMINNARTMMGLKVASLWWFGFEPCGACILTVPEHFCTRLESPCKISIQIITTELFYLCMLIIIEQRFPSYKKFQVYTPLSLWMAFRVQNFSGTFKKWATGQRNCTTSHCVLGPHKTTS